MKRMLPVGRVDDGRMPWQTEDQEGVQAIARGRPVSQQEGAGGPAGEANGAEARGRGRGALKPEARRGGDAGAEEGKAGRKAREDERARKARKARRAGRGEKGGGAAGTSLIMRASLASLGPMPTGEGGRGPAPGMQRGKRAWSRVREGERGRKEGEHVRVRVRVRVRCVREREIECTRVHACVYVYMRRRVSLGGDGHDGMRTAKHACTGYIEAQHRHRARAGPSPPGCMVGCLPIPDAREARGAGREPAAVHASPGGGRFRGQPRAPVYIPRPGPKYNRARPA